MLEQIALKKKELEAKFNEVKGVKEQKLKEAEMCEIELNKLQGAYRLLTEMETEEQLRITDEQERLLKQEQEADDRPVEE